LEQGVMVQSSSGLITNTTDATSFANDITYANAPPIKIFICPTRRGTSKPFCDYAGAFTPLQQVPSTDPQFTKTYSLLDSPGGGLTLSKIASKDGTSNTLFMAHRFVQPNNYDNINEPPQSAYDRASTWDAGWAACEGQANGVNIFQPARP